MDLMMLDRDGVINIDRSESVLNIKDFQLLPQVAQAIALLNQAQIPVAVITNQSCVGRGNLSWDNLNSIHEKMKCLLAQEGAYIDEIYICPDVSIFPNERRKPAPGMLKEALEKFKARPLHSPFIGDAIRDLQAAAALKCPRILVRTGKGCETEKEIQTIKKEVQTLKSGNESIFEKPSFDLWPVHVFDNLYTAVVALLNPSFNKRI